MRIVSVTGATGFIGQHLLRRLLSHPDMAVRALVHGAAEATLPQSKRLHWIRGDLADTSSLRGLLEPGCTLVNLAFSHRWSRQEHLAATPALAKLAAEVCVRRVVHCSTAAVVGRTAARRITEATLPEPVTDYEVTKLAIENAWLESRGSRLELAILRPTAVFGPVGRSLLKLTNDLERRPALFNYLKSCLQGDRRMNLVHVDNVVAALVFLSEAADRVVGEVFIVSDDESPINNYRDVERRLMAGLGISNYPLAPVSAPRWMLSAALRAAGRSNINPDRIYDCSKIVERGLKKPVSFEQGLADFLAWYRSRKLGPVA